MEWWNVVPFEEKIRRFLRQDKKEQKKVDETLLCQNSFVQHFSQILSDVWQEHEENQTATQSMESTRINLTLGNSFFSPATKQRAKSHGGSGWILLAGSLVNGQLVVDGSFSTSTSLKSNRVDE